MMLSLPSTTSSLLVLLVSSTCTRAFISPHVARVGGPFLQQSNLHPELRAKSENQTEDGDSSDMHPTDPAATTPEFLSGLWHLIASGNHLVKGESETLLFPEMKEKFTPRYLNLVTAHLDSCKDVCDNFGINTALVPFVEKGKVKGFTIKSFRNPDKDPDELEFPYDPMWDGDEFDYSGVDDVDLKKNEDDLPDIENEIPDDDEQIVTISKSWVSKICSDMGVCPFTSGSDMAGLPIGPVYYTVDRSTSMEDMYARYWKEVVRVEKEPENKLSTTLLISPEFCMDNVELFESFSNTLTQPLAALGLEDLLQLVFFHPQWSFRDGGERGGEGAAANYARRTPWPMINILRTKQVRAAQRGIPTGLVYKQNEKTLANIGTKKLETMLRLRDWGDVANVKVDRRDMEALRIAQDFQSTGTVAKEDTSLMSDATPAANKVDERQVEQGNLVNVVLQALEKRLGKDGNGVKQLSGPETSATIMASDFIMKELDRIVQIGQTKPEVTNAAQRAILEDFEQPHGKDEEMDVLFGRAGIMDGPAGARDKGGNFSEGLDPRNFF